MTPQEIYENTAFGRYERSLEADSATEYEIHEIMEDDLAMRELTRQAIENGEHDELTTEIIIDVISQGWTDNVKKLRMELAYRIAEKACQASART
jgi:hypothetical protein